MRSFRQMPREQMTFTLVLAVLAILALWGLSHDPRYESPGKPRLDWPPALFRKP